MRAEGRFRKHARERRVREGEAQTNRVLPVLRNGQRLGGVRKTKAFGTKGGLCQNFGGGQTVERHVPDLAVLGKIEEVNPHAVVHDPEGEATSRCSVPSSSR